MDDDDSLERIRRLCLALPETTERLSHGSPTLFIRDMKTFIPRSVGRRRRRR